jgi:hypothetical protein
MKKAADARNRGRLPPAFGGSSPGGARSGGSCGRMSDDHDAIVIRAGNAGQAAAGIARKTGEEWHEREECRAEELGPTGRSDVRRRCPTPRFFAFTSREAGPLGTALIR